jgi:cytochrome c oxidase cbb3-type subunit 3
VTGDRVHSLLRPVGKVPVRTRESKEESSVAKKGSDMLHVNRYLRAMRVLIAGLTSGLATGLSAQEQANPFTTVEDVQAGQTLFGSQCSVCHGVGAAGGEIGPDLTTGEFRNAGTDAGLFRVISEGVPNTPMVGINRTRADQSVWQLVAYLRSLSGGRRVAVSGNASAGEQLFRGRGECSSCHVVDGEGGRQGPELSTIGDRRSPDQLLSDLVDPNERVQPRWWTMRVTHRDGTRVEGQRMNEGTYSLRILDTNDNMWSFEKRDLTASERIETSSMPPNAGRLTDSELQNLVAYLYGLTRRDQ